MVTRRGRCLTRFHRFARLLLLGRPLVSGDSAKSAAEVGVHHAVDVPVEVRQDDVLRILLHLYSHWTFRSVLHVALGTANKQQVRF